MEEGGTLPETGADINAKEAWKSTPRIKATGIRHEGIVNLPLDAKGDINIIKGNTATPR